jgi:hypothetical protein
MDATKLSPIARQIEEQLESSEPSPLSDFLRQESLHRIEARSYSPSNYHIFAVRRHPQLADEVFGPKQIHVGDYSEEMLYGAVGTPFTRLQAAIRNLIPRAEKVDSLDPSQVEYSHQVTLFWAEIGRLKEFIGTSPAISELVAELRTARFQFLRKDSPPKVIRALACVFRLITEAQRLDTHLVDRIVGVLEEGGIDSLAPDSLRDSNG